MNRRGVIGGALCLSAFSGLSRGAKPARTPARSYTVKLDGSGDFRHPKLALDAISDATAASPVAILVYPGDYGGYAEWHTKAYVDIIGVGRREDIVISFSNPDDVAAATIAGTSLLWLDTTTKLTNLTLRGKNVRYVVHLETNGRRPFSIQQIINCDIEHFGNAAAVNNTWGAGSQLAIGAGNSEGQRILCQGSRLVGPGGGFSYHLPNGGGGYRVPTETDIEGCRIEGWTARLSANTENGSDTLVVTSASRFAVGVGSTIAGPGIPPETTVISLRAGGYGGPGSYQLSERATATQRDIALTTSAPSVRIKPIGKGVGDRCRLVGNTFVGDVVYSDSEWRGAIDARLNHAQIRVEAKQNSGFVFSNQIRGLGARYRPTAD